MTAMTKEQVARRRAVEALRSGVPSWDAVAALGSGQPEAEDRYASLLDAVEGGKSGGLLLGAGFGAGKSHLLLHLAHLALERGCAVSTVVVSKETPLYDPAKVYRAAVESLLGPGRVSGLLADAAASLDPDSPRYSELTRWLHAPSRPLDERFAATLLLHEKLRGGEVPDGDEIVDAVVRFWSGDPIRVPDLRRALKAVGAGGLYSFAAISAKELARQRLRFAARLLRAAGHPGWVILFDEVELIGRYSRLEAPDSGELDRAYAVLKALHGDAYEWSPPDVPGLERLGNTRMRQYVRAWINAWDLVRLDPDHAPDTEVVELTAFSYEHDEALDADRAE